MSLLAEFEKSFMPNYGRPPVALVRGEGMKVWDEDGKEYLDFIAGIAVSSLGHAHPDLVAAVSAQVATIAHTSNLFVNRPEVELADKLLGLLGAPARVFLANTGTEANEAALKLVLKHRKGYLVAAENGFHGRSMGAMALTGKASIREPFGPYGQDVRFVPYGDADALREAVTPECAGVFLEPALGEGGVVPAPEGYLRAAREVCDATGAVFVMDEIQSAIGRTGTWFAHQHEGIVPDVLTLAKGLGGGLPIGACVGFGRYGEVFGKGDHGSTFGGNPVSCAAALTVLSTIEKDGLLANATAVGDLLKSGLAAIDHPSVKGVRGRGLWLALVTEGPQAGLIQDSARTAGFLVNAVQPDAVRIAPPLTITLEHAQAFLDALPEILETLS